MTNEIKEILKLIGNAYYYGNINEEQKEKYCNYITNLQEENEKQHKGFLAVYDNGVYMIELEETIDRLEKRNKKLKQEISRLKNGIKELDNMFYETFRISQNDYYSISEWELKDFTDKLKELKEEGK